MSNNSISEVPGLDAWAIDELAKIGCIDNSCLIRQYLCMRASNEAFKKWLKEAIVAIADNAAKNIVISIEDWCNKFMGTEIVAKYRAGDIDTPEPHSFNSGIETGRFTKPALREPECLFVEEIEN